MADAFIIAHRDRTAGIAVRERGGFRFYSSNDLFLRIDSRKFRRLRGVKIAVKRLADSAQNSAIHLRTADHSAPRDRELHALPF